MSYEQAPATKMVATHCAFCARPLVDAQSVETGVGPVCRERHMVPDSASNEHRPEANRLIHQIARLQKGPEVRQLLVRLDDLGYRKAAARIRKRLRRRFIREQQQSAPKVRISYEDGRILVKATPKGAAFRPYLNRCRDIIGRRWHDAIKSNSFPEAAKPQVWALLRDFFAGAQAEGPKGTFVIPSR